MTKELKEPTSLLEGITHREMINVMSDAGIFCSVDKFTRVLQWAQQRMYESLIMADDERIKGEVAK